MIPDNQTNKMMYDEPDAFLLQHYKQWPIRGWVGGDRGDPPPELVLILKTYEKLIDACVSCGDQCFPKVKKKENQIPYWDESVKPLKDDALFWHQIWVSCGKPIEMGLYHR